jgi:hypothetical protein
MVDKDSHGKRWLPIMALIALTFMAHLLVLANPGFFNHDEWQRADHVEAHGLVNYLKSYTVVLAGPDFGYPVRPIGFAQQGISAIWMQTYPVIPHAIDVVLHSAVVVLLWSVLLRVGFERRRAAWAAAIFAICPLATFSVGWVGASFDRWYALFSLVCAHGVVSAAREGLDEKAIALVLLGSCGAILSKETAIVLPAALLVMGYSLWLSGKSQYRVRPALGAIALSGLPILIYIAIRWPAIQATLSSHGGPYAPAMVSIPGNVLLYLAQPFILRAVEVMPVSFVARWELWLALALHGLLLAAIWRRYGWRAPLTYAAGYFVFLLPVLPLPNQGAHYLYASGIPFAIAFALLLAPRRDAGVPRRFSRGRTAVAGAVMLFLLGRSLVIQENLYSAGKCQAEFLASFKPMAEEAMAGGSDRLHITAAPGAREYIAHRALFGRMPFSEEGQWPTVVGATQSSEGDGNFVMQPNCTVLRQ